MVERLPPLDPTRSGSPGGHRRHGRGIRRDVRRPDIHPDGDRRLPSTIGGQPPEHLRRLQERRRHGGERDALPRARHREAEAEACPLRRARLPRDHRPDRPGVHLAHRMGHPHLRHPGHNRRRHLHRRVRLQVPRPGAGVRVLHDGHPDAPRGLLRADRGVLMGRPAHRPAQRLPDHRGALRQRAEGLRGGPEGRREDPVRPPQIRERQEALPGGEHHRVPAPDRPGCPPSRPMGVPAGSGLAVRLLRPVQELPEGPGRPAVQLHARTALF